MISSKKKRIQIEELNNCFTNCKIPNAKVDRRLMAINDKYLLMAWDGKPGEINYVNSNKPCNFEKEYNIFSIENSNILDMEFSPFNSDMLYFSNDNKKIYLAEITEKNEILSDFYNFHTNKVYFINSNPVASNVICSSTSLGEIHIWDSVKFKPQIKLKASNIIDSILWNPNGSLIGFSIINRLLTIIDPRNSLQIFEEQITDINTPAKFVWLNDHSLAAIGYKKSDKQFYLNLYDIRHSVKNPFNSKKICSNDSSLTSFVNQELNLIYIAAKDESYIRLYDYSNGTIQKYGKYKTIESNNFSIQLNRKYLNKKKEIDRFARLTKKNNIFYTSFILKDNNYDTELIYPNEISSYPQITSEEWFRGKIIYNKTIPQNSKNNKQHKESNKNDLIIQNKNKAENYEKNSSKSTNKYEENKIQNDNTRIASERKQNNSKINYINDNHKQLEENNNLNKHINIQVNIQKNTQSININSNPKDKCNNKTEKAEKECNYCKRMKNIISELENDKTKLNIKYNNLLTSYNSCNNEKLMKKEQIITAKKKLENYEKKYLENENQINKLLYFIMIYKKYYIMISIFFEKMEENKYRLNN